MIPRAPFRIVTVSGFALMSLIGSSAAQGSLELLRNGLKAEIELVETDAIFKKVELADKYIAALDALEGKYTAQGNLDAISHVREERELVKKSSGTSSHPDTALVELRGKYLKAIGEIGAALETAKQQIETKFIQNTKDQEIALAKAGKMNEAVALRNDRQQLVSELPKREPFKPGAAQLFSIKLPATTSAAKPVLVAPVTKGQQVTITPKTVKWSGGGSQKGKFTDWQGYDSKEANKLPWMALIADVGGTPFWPKDDKLSFSAPADGNLALYANDSSSGDNKGEAEVTVEVRTAK